MEFIKKIFGTVRTSYLIRAYVFSGIFTAILIKVSLEGKKEYLSILYGILCFILFPFSKLVYDEIKKVILGDNIFIINLIILLTAKLIINMILYGFAWVIAPIGILYLVYRIKQNEKVEN